MCRYVGQWKDGKMHGHGVKTDPQGNMFEGEWKEGKPVLKDKDSANGLGNWLNETVGSVTGPSRKDYQRVSTHDDD